MRNKLPTDKQGRLEMCLITQECYGTKSLYRFKNKKVLLFLTRGQHHDLGAYFGLNSGSFSCSKEKSV